MNKKYTVSPGDTFNNLTIVSEAEKQASSPRVFICKCKCGNFIKTLLSSIKYGHTKSCGCLNSKRASIFYSKLNLAHGHSKAGKVSPTYKSWSSMKRRCGKSNVLGSKYYKDRGIQVCARWNIFENFLADMGERPYGMTLDRIDVNGNYCKENCRWATVQEQNNNKQNNKKVLFNGEKITIREFSEKISYPIRIVRERLRLGWTIERIVNTPPRRYMDIRT
jgi:hypothetical protein